MPGEFEDEPFEDTGETPSEEGGAEPGDGGGAGGEDQPFVGEVEPTAQDEAVGAAEPDAGVLSPEEVAALDESMTTDRKEMGPMDDLDTAIAHADTTPPDVEPTSPA